MFVFVTLRQGCDGGLNLRELTTAFINVSGRSNARNGEDGVEIIASLLDLTQLAFQSKPISFCSGKFAAQFL